MASTAEQLAAYKAQVDRKYRGHSRWEDATAETQSVERGTPAWLLIDPDGKVDGFHGYRAGKWDSVEAVWKRFEPNKRDREALLDAGWTVRRDDAEGSGLAAFRASDRH